MLVLYSDREECDGEVGGGTFPVPFLSLDSYDTNVNRHR